tara:strand:- start:1963 stop:2349 length:387 start_codon:yes stop_codon:yes gene_type:complete
MKWIIFRNVKIDEKTIDVAWDIQEHIKKKLAYKVPYNPIDVDEMNGILQACKKTLDRGYDLLGADIEGQLHRVKFSEIESQLEPDHAEYLKYMVNTTNRKTRFEMEQWLQKEQPEIYDYMCNAPDRLN